MMHLFSTSRLRTRLVLMALIAIVPAFAVILYAQSIERRFTRERTMGDGLQLMRLAADQEGAIIDGAQRVLQTLALVPAFRASDPRACNELLRDVLRDHPGYISFGVVNLDGWRFCSSVTVALQNRDRLWFQRAVQTRTTALGGYQISRVNGQPDIVVARPLLSASGAVQRVMFAAVEPKPHAARVRAPQMWNVHHSYRASLLTQ